jgi:hypothetical protein
LASEIVYLLLIASKNMENIPQTLIFIKPQLASLFHDVRLSIVLGRYIERYHLHIFKLWDENT